MHGNKPNDDAPLDALLRDWKVKSSLPPHFKEQVWRRIERSEAAPPASLSIAALVGNWIANLLSRPALATAYMAVLVAIGAGAGWSQARQETARVFTDLSARYTQAVDPYQSAP